MESEDEQEAETTQMAQAPVGTVGSANVNQEVAAISWEWRTWRAFKERFLQSKCFWPCLLLGVLVGILFVVSRKVSVQHCPNEWVGYREKCYFISEEEKNWTSSRTFCNKNESLLVIFENQEEMVKNNNCDEDEFLYARLKCRKHLYLPAYLDQAAYVEIDKHYSLVKLLKIDDSWIGLRKKGESFYWENGIALEADLFQIRNHSECAYLDGFTISTSACSLPRRWICVQPHKAMI